MDLKAAKRFFMVVLLLLTFALILGCAGMEYKRGTGLVPVELRDADRALDAARMAGKDKACPAQYAEAAAMRDFAYETHLACNTPEGRRLAKEAKQKADSLCPPKATLERPAPAPPPIPAALAATLPPPVPAAQIIEKLSLHVHFYKNSAVIDKKDYKHLNEAVTFVKKYPGANVVLEGHTDNDGDENANLNLSQKRADTVGKYLITKGGIAASKIKSYGYGEYRPLKSNDEKWGKYWNRRVDILIVK